MMREPTYLILAALAARPQHGYAIIGEVDRLSDGRVRLRPGTLYAALDRLATDGSVAIHGETVVDGRLRRTYRITDEGRASLEAAADRLADNVKVARRQLALGLRGAGA